MFAIRAKLGLTPPPNGCCPERLWAHCDKRNEFAEELASEEGRQQFFRIAKLTGRDRRYVSGSSCVKDEHGIIVTERDGVKEVWAKCVDKLLNVRNVQVEFD